MRTCCIPNYHAATREPEWTSLSLAIVLSLPHNYARNAFVQRTPPAPPRLQSSLAEMLFQMS